MANTELYKSDYIVVEYNPDHKMIHHTVLQPIGAAQTDIFKEALQSGTEGIKKYKVSKWLSDDRKNGPLVPEMIEWSENNWYRPTIAAGWQYWANVVPAEIEAAQTLSAVINYLHTLGLRMSVFTDTESAIKWLDTLE